MQALRRPNVVRARLLSAPYVKDRLSSIPRALSWRGKDRSPAAEWHLPELVGKQRKRRRRRHFRCLPTNSGRCHSAAGERSFPRHERALGILESRSFTYGALNKRARTTFGLRSACMGVSSSYERFPRNTIGIARFPRAMLGCEQ